MPSYDLVAAFWHFSNFLPLQGWMAGRVQPIFTFKGLKPDTSLQEASTCMSGVWTTIVEGFHPWDHVQNRSMSLLLFRTTWCKHIGLELPRVCGKLPNSIVMEPQLSQSGRGSKPQIHAWGATFNPHLELHWYSMPLPEDLMCKLSGEYCFIKIDLADVYNKIALGLESQNWLALSISQGAFL